MSAYGAAQHCHTLRIRLCCFTEQIVRCVGSKATVIAQALALTPPHRQQGAKRKGLACQAAPLGH